MAAVGAFECLKEWALRYVRHMDLPLKRISEIKDSDYGFDVVNSDGTSISCIIQLSFKDIPKEFTKAAAGKKSVLIVALSNEENIRAVCGMWDSLAANQTLLIVFVNPFSAQEEKWVLKPSLHNKVCDRASLLQGLKAMAELVEPVDADALAVRVRELNRFPGALSQKPALQ